MRLRILVFAVILSLLFISSSGFSARTAADSSVITDISWPNCNARTSELTEVGIVGVNDGLDYSHNPCLNSETRLFHNQYALYLNTGYPGSSFGIKFANYPKRCNAGNYLCLAYNYGYNDVLYSLKYANEQDAHSFVWWLDVESENSWTNDYKQNRESLIGMVEAIKQNTFVPIVGFYSYPGQWKTLTKSWNVNIPNWVATGSSSKKLARAYCSLPFSKSQVWLSQYTTSLDYNYSCLPNTINSFKVRF